MPHQAQERQLAHMMLPFVGAAPGTEARQGICHASRRARRIGHRSATEHERLSLGGAPGAGARLDGGAAGVVAGGRRQLGDGRVLAHLLPRAQDGCLGPACSPHDLGNFASHLV